MNPLQIAAYFDILGQSQKAYGRLLEPVCRRFGLTRSEVDVLLFLYNNPGFDRAADIVSRRGMAKSHVSVSVTTLAQRELLQRCCSEADRRTVHLRLTEQGRSIAAQARAAQQEFFTVLYQGITPEESAVWEKITQQVCENVKKLNG